MAALTYTDSFAELNALFNATFAGAWNTIAQNSAAPATNLFVSLHNATPGPTGTQSTNESIYTGYARVSVARTTGGWTVTQGSGTTFSNVVNAASVTFPACGITGDTLTHWGIGLASAGAGTLLAFGEIGPTAGPGVGFTATAAAPGVLTCPGYTPAVNDRVSCYQIPFSQGLPGGITEGTVYFVGTAPGGQTLTLSTTTANGAPVTTTTTGCGILYKQGILVISSGVTPSFAAGALSLQKA